MADNKRVILVAAPASSGKTHSLLKLASDPHVAYLNTDLKDLPFKVAKDGMKCLQISDPKIVPDAITDLENNYPDVHTVILDTITILMNTYEAEFVTGDTRGFGAAWQEYAQFYTSLMRQIKMSSKNYIVLAHTNTEFKEEEGAFDTKVPVKGAVGKVGVEADYNIVISARKMSAVALKPYLTEANKLLTLTPREERLGFKFVFQTDLTKESLSEKIRSPMGLWKEEELYIDNDISHLIQRLAEYYS